jgi:flagellar basal-body rod protein FlgC
MSTLDSIMSIAASGMHAQGKRLQVIAENVANAETTGNTPGADPYRRKLITFEEVFDEVTGANRVGIAEISKDQSPFDLEYDPAHPAADASGMVKIPNVNTFLEMANMREASRSYEANMNVLDAGRRMRSQIIDMLK